VFEVYLGVIGPEFPANLFPRHDVPGALKQHCKDSKGLLGKTDGVTTIPAKLARTKIEFEIFEPRHTTRARYFLHASSPRARILTLVLQVERMTGIDNEISDRSQFCHLCRVN
jgi:hypothetical protein